MDPGSKERSTRSMPEGERLAWERLGELDQRDVCRRADVHFDTEGGAYIVPMFSHRMTVAIHEGDIRGLDRQSDHFLSDRRRLARLPLLRYLIHASDVSPSGILSDLSAAPGGRIYEEGTHVLPLHLLGGHFGTDLTAFQDRGRELKGERLEMGDSALRLRPFPKISFAFILWLGDGEFPARTVMLADSSNRHHLPPDMLWLTAMLCLSAMLPDSSTASWRY